MWMSLGINRGMALNNTCRGRATAANKQQFLAVTSDEGGKVSVYPINQTTGLGVKLADPSVVPGGIGEDVAFAPDGSAIAVAHTSTPFISVYAFSASGGIGAKFANPLTLPTGAGYGVAFSPSGNAIAVSHANSPLITAYSWSSAGFGAKFANPAVLAAGTGLDVTFSPTGNAVVLTELTGGIHAWEWSDTGFGLKYADPATTPVGQGRANQVAFSPDGAVVATVVSGQSFNSNKVYVYQWSASTGFGTRYPQPTPSIAAYLGYWGVAFSRQGDAIFIFGAGGGGPQGPQAWAWSNASGFGATYANPNLMEGQSISIDYSLEGDIIAAAEAVWPWSSASGFGPRFANPSVMPVGTRRSTAFGRA